MEVKASNTKADPQKDRTPVLLKFKEPKNARLENKQQNTTIEHQPLINHS